MKSFFVRASLLFTALFFFAAGGFTNVSAAEQLPVFGNPTASSHDGNVPENTIDGSLSTRWSANGDGSWIQYDLGSSKDVTFIKIAWYKGANRSAEFKVQTSANASTWGDVLGLTSSSGSTTSLETYDLTDSSARYVRIVGYGNTSNNWNSITEVEIWGGGQPGPNPADYPSDVLSFFNEFKITLGTGSEVTNLINYKHDDYFFTANDGVDWVVYKTPNQGGTTPNSSNTRSELRQFDEWTPEQGGKLTGTLKVMHVSTTGNATVPAAYSVVIGQIHSSEGHENEPVKIFYKKYPGHTKGAVFWNYEINTNGSNSGRWDVSHKVWGYDWSHLGSSANSYPSEPSDGVELGEEFSYEINVYNGVLYLRFECNGKTTKTFAKDLTSSVYTQSSDIPSQVVDLFGPEGQDGTEYPNAYSGELQYFKQGAYNQCNGGTNHSVWSPGCDTYNGNLNDQYSNGAYTEVWFRQATVGNGTSN